MYSLGILLVVFFVFNAFHFSQYSKFYNFISKSSVNALSQPRVDLEITNGEEVDPNSMPYMVVIKATIDNRPVLCGGTLIDDGFVLTAAKCIDGADSVDVIFGAHNISAAEKTQITKTLKKESFIIYDGYNDTTLEHNIALLDLVTPIKENENITTIAIPTIADNSNTYAGKTGTIAGWGKLHDTSSTYSATLQKADVIIIPRVDCFLDHRAIQMDEMCTSGSRKINICLGDSGGPLIVKGVQVGISSHGSDFGCEVGIPSIYTRLTSYTEWIGPTIAARKNK